MGHGSQLPTTSLLLLTIQVTQQVQQGDPQAVCTLHHSYAVCVLTGYKEPGQQPLLLSSNNLLSCAPSN